MGENSYLKSFEKRAKEQTKISQDIKDEVRIEKLNITIPSDYKKKLKEYCEKNYTSPAAFIRMCIDEYC